MRSFFEHEISNQINFANSERHISEVLTHKDPIHTPITLFEFGLPKYQLQRLQYVQNTAARVVLQVSKFSAYHTCFVRTLLATDSISYYFQDSAPCV